jgi:hypothetical protein
MSRDGERRRQRRPGRICQAVAILPRGCAQAASLGDKTTPGHREGDKSGTRRVPGSPRHESESDHSSRRTFPGHSHLTHDPGGAHPQRLLDQAAQGNLAGALQTGLATLHRSHVPEGDLQRKPLITREDARASRLAARSGKPFPNASPRDTVDCMWSFLIKLYVFSGMLVWPAWTSVAGKANWGNAVEATVAILVIGLVLGWMFPARLMLPAILGIPGGVVGVLVGLFYGVTKGYWVGAGMSVGFIVASTIVAVFCRKRIDSLHGPRPEVAPKTAENRASLVIGMTPEEEQRARLLFLKPTLIRDGSLKSFGDLTTEEIEDQAKLAAEGTWTSGPSAEDLHWLNTVLARKRS